MDTFIFALNAVLPIIILMIFGYILKHIGFINDNFVSIGNKFVYRIALPVLLFYNIYKIESLSAIQWNHVVFASAGIIFLFVLGMMIVKLTIPDHRQKGVVVQAIFRANFAIIGVPLAESIGGDVAVVNLSMVSAIAIPLMNILSVLALTMYMGDGQTGQVKKTMIKIIKNPLIAGIAIGMVVLAVRSLVPMNGDELAFSLEEDLKFLFLPIQWISQTTSPIALIVLGGGFHIYVIKHLSKQITISTITRALIAPLLVLSAAVALDHYTTFFNFDYLVYPVFIALFASPTAISGAVMAKEMHNDEDLANQVVVWTTLMSIISIFLTVLIMRLLEII